VIFWADAGKDQLVNDQSKCQLNPITIQQGHDVKVRLIIIYADQGTQLLIYKFQEVLSLKDGSNTQRQD
jgi:hypothetical protein